MKPGVGIKTAMSHATADPELHQTQVTASVGVAIHTAECRALSAPCLIEAYALQGPGGEEEGREGTKAGRGCREGSES